MAVVCSVCKESFPFKSALDTHKRLVHQDTAVVTLADGSTLTIKRRDCGDGRQGFPCPNSNCTYWTANPQHLHKHCKRCGSGASFQTTVDLAEILHQDQSQSSPHSSLADYGLFADPELSVLICRKCQYAINPHPRHVRNHLQEKHTGRIPTIAKLREALQVKELRQDDNPMLRDYTEPRADPLHPIKGIKVHNGLKCRSCTHFCVTRESMRVHWHECHAESRFCADSYTACLVQTLFKGAISIIMQSSCIKMFNVQGERPSTSVFAIWNPLFKRIQSTTTN
jgi:hypothetical protein